MKVLAMPDVRAKLLGLGGEPGTLTSAEFAAMNKADFDRFGKLVREAGIKSEQ
jgi:tripartite-type tricarboxylate transporter receptor subunit TctC